jgi:hypothetical protein
MVEEHMDYPIDPILYKKKILISYKISNKTYCVRIVVMLDGIQDLLDILVQHLYHYQDRQQIYDHFPMEQRFLVVDLDT